MLLPFQIETSWQRYLVHIYAAEGTLCLLVLNNWWRRWGQYQDQSRSCWLFSSNKIIYIHTKLSEKKDHSSVLFYFLFVLCCGSCFWRVQIISSWRAIFFDKVHGSFNTFGLSNNKQNRHQLYFKIVWLKWNGDKNAFQSKAYHPRNT